MSKLYDEAAVIVWACGYETNSLPVLDLDGAPVELSTDRGQVAVDEEARITTRKFIEGVSIPSCASQQKKVSSFGAVDTLSSAKGEGERAQY